MQRPVEKRAGVMGWPVKHSLSPKLHGYWIEHYNLAAAYDLLPVEPENLENALESLLVNGYAGCNLTLPHKEKAATLVDDLSPAARAVQAVNTVVVDQEGRLFGDNTDIYGFIESLNA
ncbi:MAG: shikimate dehydrogenase family protein, partial [Pseudomonadota bacterium]